MMHFEHTDTFGGEANYCWVRRLDVTPDVASDLGIKPDATNRAIVRAAKRWAGLTGYRCETESYGDTIAIRPRHLCQVVFVTFSE